MPAEPLTLFSQAESGVVTVAQWLKLGVETIGALTIALGIMMGARLFLKALLARRTADFTAIRLTLARYLALEFQLGADILSTAIAPSWDQIGKLGAVAIIRTALNFFLSREMKEERKDSAEHHIVSKAVSGPSGNHEGEKL